MSMEFLEILMSESVSPYIFIWSTLFNIWYKVHVVHLHKVNIQINSILNKNVLLKK